MDKYLNECIGNCKDDGVKALLLLQKDIEKNNEHHLRQQDLLLQIIRKQSKPNFWREVGANLTGDAIFEVLLRGASRIFNDREHPHSFGCAGADEREGA